MKIMKCKDCDCGILYNGGVNTNGELETITVCELDDDCPYKED